MVAAEGEILRLAALVAQAVVVQVAHQQEQELLEQQTQVVAEVAEVIHLLVQIQVRLVLLVVLELLF